MFAVECVLSGGEIGVTPEEFRAWRKGLGLGQKEAAERLGLRKRMIQYYEKGERDGKTVEVPLTVSLACFAVTKHVVQFDGVKPKKLRSSDRPKKASRKSASKANGGKSTKNA
ncbi:MAG: helix-turn-helix transcriptional regulator [Pseudomonadota bacterium]